MTILNVTSLANLSKHSLLYEKSEEFHHSFVFVFPCCVIQLQVQLGGENGVGLF